MPAPRKVNGNSKGEEGFKSPIFLKESMTLKWNFQRGGGGGMDNLWNNTFKINEFDHIKLKIKKL